MEIEDSAYRALDAIVLVLLNAANVLTVSDADAAVMPEHISIEFANMHPENLSVSLAVVKGHRTLRRYAFRSAWAEIGEEVAAEGSIDAWISTTVSHIEEVLSTCAPGEYLM